MLFGRLVMSESKCGGGSAAVQRLKTNSTLLMVETAPRSDAGCESTLVASEPGVAPSCSPYLHVAGETLFCASAAPMTSARVTVQERSGGRHVAMLRQRW